MSIGIAYHARIGLTVSTEKTTGEPMDDSGTEAMQDIIKQAQEASGILGWSRTIEICGQGGLSGATEASLLALILIAEADCGLRYSFRQRRIRT